MYAIIQAGGKQHRVEVGQRVAVEREGSNLLPGSELLFENVLLVRDDQQVRIGRPSLDGARVRATLLRELRGDKVLIFKKKRRKGYRKTQGHRQHLLEVRIDAIEA